jgi:hypothetical protein
MAESRRVGKVLSLEEREAQKALRKMAKIGRCRICGDPLKYIVIDPFAKDERCEDCFLPNIDFKNKCIFLKNGFFISLENVTVTLGKPDPKGIINSFLIKGVDNVSKKSRE